MKTINRSLIIKLLFLLPFTCIIQSFAGSGRLFPRELSEESWKFAKKDTLSLETMGKSKVFITGSNSGEIEIKLFYIAKPDEKFEVKEEQRTIYLKEYILNYNPHTPTQKYFEGCTLIIAVPNGIFIKCNGSSSEFEVTAFDGVFEACYASGKFIFKNTGGSIDLQMAMLRAKIRNSRGSFKMSSAMGFIKAKGLIVDGSSNFSSGMGDINISLACVPAADLYVCSSFRKARINFNNHPVKGNFEFIARADEGKIISPFEFEKEETFLDDVLNYSTSSDFGKKADFNRKSFVIGDIKPKITLKTVTGTAQLTR